MCQTSLILHIAFRFYSYFYCFFFLVIEIDIFFVGNAERCKYDRLIIYVWWILNNISLMLWILWYLSFTYNAVTSLFRHFWMVSVTKRHQTEAIRDDNVSTHEKGTLLFWTWKHLFNERGWGKRQLLYVINCIELHFGHMVGN